MKELSSRLFYPQPEKYNLREVNCKRTMRRFLINTIAKLRKVIIKAKWTNVQKVV